MISHTSFLIYLDKTSFLTIIKFTQAMTEKSTLAGTDRDAGAQTETPARKKPAEVPSRAVQVNAPPGAGSLGRKRCVTGAADE